MKLKLQTLLLATAITLLSSACGKSTAPAAPRAGAAATPEAQATASGLALVDFKLSKNAAGKPVLTGKVSNSAAQKIAHASIDFKLLDDKNNEVGTVTAGVDNLQAKFSWSFEVEVLPAGVASAKFVGFRVQ
jgi:hypothetical protein